MGIVFLYQSSIQYFSVKDLMIWVSTLKSYDLTFLRYHLINHGNKNANEASWYCFVMDGCVVVDGLLSNTKHICL